MNYNDEILENKAFSFFKQLLLNLAIAICVILAFFVVMVYAFGYRPYNVLTGSMEPAISAGDLVIVKSQDEYQVGDVIKFQLSDGGLPVTHRIVEIVDNNGTTIYRCRGDNPNISDTEIQNVRLQQIEGKVVYTIDNWGTYITFVDEHKFLIIALVISIWCITCTVQNELDMRKDRRMMIA